MTIAIIYITLGVLYTVACVMDGQDVKPLWKRWLGTKLANMAEYYKPIDYCVMPQCKFYNEALQAERERRQREYQAKILLSDELAYNALILEEAVCIGEREIMQEFRRYGNHTKAVLKERAKQHIAAAISKAIEQNNLIRYEEREMPYETYIVGQLRVARKR